MIKSEWRRFERRMQEVEFEFRRHAQNVEAAFFENPKLMVHTHSAVHSTKLRMKNPIHLKEKIIRKRAKGEEITPENLTSEITDLAGVRILLLFRSDFDLIDRLIRRRVADGDWSLGERGKALVWDPEDEQYFSGYDLDVECRTTHYTSVHYLIKPRPDVDTCCELQVRTLFEEIWGEVDHRLNYPVKTSNVGCKEQLRVLSKLTGAGSRLLESIQRTSKK